MAAIRGLQKARKRIEVLLVTRKEQLTKHESTTMAEQVEVSFFNGAELIVAGITTMLHHKVNQGFKSFTGSFTVSSLTPIPHGGPFKMVTKDGRSGEVLFLEVLVGGHRPTTVNFQSTGPFG